MHSAYFSSVDPLRLVASVCLAVAVLTAGASVAFAQDADTRDWRRTDMSKDTLGATAVESEIDGVKRVTVVILAPVDRQLTGEAPYRSVVFESEVRCSERMWRVTSATYYALDFSVADRHGPVPSAPLVRETPLHAAISDACDGGYANDVGLKAADPLEALRWLGKMSSQDAD